MNAYIFDMAQKRKEQAIENVVDYFQEKAYLCDVCIEEANYYIFFEKLYEAFEKKGIASIYFDLVSQFVFKVITDNRDQLIDVDTLTNNLELLNVIIPNNIVKITDKDFELLKQELVQPKAKVLQLNQLT